MGLGEGDGWQRLYYDNDGLLLFLVNGLVLVYYSICHWQWNMVAFVGIFLHIFRYLLLLVLSLKYSDIIYVSKDFYKCNCVRFQYLFMLVILNYCCLFLVNCLGFGLTDQKLCPVRM